MFYCREIVIGIGVGRQNTGNIAERNDSKLYFFKFEEIKLYCPNAGKCR